MSALIWQRPCDSLAAIGEQLHEAFVVVRSAIEAGEPAVIVVNAPDLLGQGSLEDAALATGLVGLMRATTFEGGSKGWHVNVVAIDPGTDPPAAVLQAAREIASLKGQVLNLSAGQVGKVIP